MTETFRQAAIGADISVSGIDDLFKANDYMDKLIDKSEKLRSEGKKSNESVQGLNENNTGLQALNRSTQEATNSYRFMSNEINKAKATVENLKNTIIGQNSEIQQMKQRMNELRQNNPVLQSIRDNFKNNNKVIKENVNNVKKLSDSINQIHSDNIKRLGSDSEETGRKMGETEKSMHRFRDTALGTFAGNIFANTFGSIPGVLKDATEQGLKFSSAGADVKKNWANAGLSGTDADGMIKQLGEIQQHANISAGSIVNMQKQYLGLTNGNVGQAQKLTSSVTSFGKESGMGERQNKMLNRMMSSNNKVNAGMFNKTALGPLRNEIIQMSGMTKGAFENMLNSGKLTGDKLRGYMIDASKDSGKAWNQYLQTDAGKADMFHATMTKTKKLFDTGVSGNLFSSIQQIVGQHKSLAEVQKTVKGLAATLGKTVGTFMGRAIGFITKNEGSLKAIGTAIWNIVKAISSGAWETIKGVLNAISGHAKSAHNGLNGMASALTAISKHQSMLKAIGGTLVTIFAVSKIMKSVIFIGKFIKTLKELKVVLIVTKGAMLVLRAAQWALNVAMDANPIGLIITAVAALGFGIYELYKHFKPFRKIVNGAFSSAGKVIKKVGKWFGGVGHTIAKSTGHMISSVGKFGHSVSQKFGDAKKSASNFAKSIAGKVQNTYSKGMAQLKKHSLGTYKTIKSGTNVLSDFIHGDFSKMGKDIPDLAHNMWNSVSGKFTKGFGSLKDITHDAISSISNTFKSWGSSIGSFFKNLWSGIENTFKSAINWLSNLIKPALKGVNWITSKLGGKTINVDAFHLANGTMNGKLQKNSLAMLNDGHDSPETGNKELVQLPNGKEFIPQKRNWVGMLPKGSRVFNATQTKMLMELRGIRKYAGGGIIGDITSGIGNVAHKAASGIGHITHGAERLGSKALHGVEHAGSSAWNWTKSAAGGLWNGAKGVANAVAHPIKFIKSLFSGLPKMPEMVENMAGGMLNKVKNAALSFFNNNAGETSNPGGASMNRWKPVIKKAAAIMHQALSGNDMAVMLHRIFQESTGDPHRHQEVQDINSEEGHPSYGLMQFIPSTFNAWKVPGHGNQGNGLDNILATMNDSNWRTDIAVSGGWGPTGRKARKNGGPVKKDEIYRVNEDGFELFKPKKDGKVLNHTDSKRVINNSNRPIKVNYNPTINLNGTDITKDDVDESLASGIDVLMDSLNSKTNEEGGSIIG
ncbi:hypothetical protein MOO46_07590 (plasmid) [Apilactobacillus apisilvae]|uniref:SLT domain protein n=1 Tax=Apilactobacillus apisilvae TaxID=2923364 RepID=A0ABY4PJZ8_9LACO|nr:hypothetical protein [Apilactobacillus apisilvae]UQS85787.1 hypothetical protein MOO46_07590 [Apilactobacillus apisilvae]